MFLEQLTKALLVVIRCCITSKKKQRTDKTKSPFLCNFEVIREINLRHFEATGTPSGATASEVQHHQHDRQ